MADDTIPIPDEIVAPDPIPGFPGYRNRPGRSGLDYLDTQYEMAHMAGVMFRKLITGNWRKRGSESSPLVMLVMGILIILLIPGPGYACPAILLVFICGIVVAIRDRRKAPVEETDGEAADVEAVDEETIAIEEPEIETPMDWKEFIRGVYKENQARAGLKPVFRPPASEDDLLAAEDALGVVFPAPLRELLSQADGFTEELLPGSSRERTDGGSVLMAVDEIVEATAYHRNSVLRSNIFITEMVFFLDARMNGIYFAIRVIREEIYAWDPKTSKFRPVAGSLEEFLRGWLSGSIEAQAHQP